MNIRRHFVLLGVVIFLIWGIYLALPFIYQEEAPQLSEEKVQEMLGDSESFFIPKFEEIPVDFVHEVDKNNPFAGSALIDIDGDGVEEVFIGGGPGQQDALLKYDGSGFVNMAEELGITEKGITFGVISADYENDGDVDLIAARGDALQLYENIGGKFESSVLDLPLDLERHAGAFSLSAADLNGDDLLDFYVSTFTRPEFFKAATFNDPGHVTKNVLLYSSDDGYENMTASSGIDFAQNTFQTSFVDLDGDFDLDFVAATNTDKVQVYENESGKFENRGPLGDFGFWMGMGIEDYDNDGDLDLFFSNSGNTLPENVARGDLRADQVFDQEWALWRNDGEMQFTQVNEETGLLDFEFAWGGEFADFNLDGREDLVVVENYVKWPAHKLNKLPARFLLQSEDGLFVASEGVVGAENPHFGMTPLMSDFNSDGYPDLFYVNLDGNSRALINQGGDNNSLTVRLPDNARSIGAKVTVKLNSGEEIIRYYTPHVGLLSDQSHNIFFGLGQGVEVEEVQVERPNGGVGLYDQVELNSVLEID